MRKFFGLNFNCLLYRRWLLYTTIKIFIISIIRLDNDNNVEALIPSSIMTTSIKMNNHENIRFIYINVPTSTVKTARRLGQLARHAYENLLKERRTNEEKHELQGDYLLECEKLGNSNFQTISNMAKIVPENLQEIINGRQNEEINNINSESAIRKNNIKRLVNAIGINAMAGEIFELNGDKLVEKIAMSCRKNELQFQCAYGFFNNLSKIRAYIELFKEDDGIFKVMAEQECKLPDDEINRTSIYTCLGKNTHTIWQQCRQQIEEYNRTRHDTNQQMETTLDAIINRIDEQVQRAIANVDQLTLNRVLKSGELLIGKTLQELTKVEAYKCRHFMPMENCLLEVLRPKCQPMVADSLSTILRVGYLQRERGIALHQQFLEASVEPHRSCAHINM